MPREQERSEQPRPERRSGTFRTRPLGSATRVTADARRMCVRTGVGVGGAIEFREPQPQRGAGRSPAKKIGHFSFGIGRKWDIWGEIFELHLLHFARRADNPALFSLKLQQLILLLL